MPPAPDRPLVVLSASPRRLDQLFRPATWDALCARFEVVALEDVDELEQYLPSAFAIVGQPRLDAGRLARATALRALLNVEGNFFPNVDYDGCFARGIHVLGCGPAFAVPVAEYALGLALDLCRGISREDRAFRAAVESYGSPGTDDSIVLRGADVGLIGFGNLGRALNGLLVPFRATVRGFDPWLPDAVLREHGVLPCGLDDLLATSRVVFVLATVTAQSEHLLGPRELALIPPGGRLVLVSRSAVVDVDALLDRVDAGHLLAAIDVWPQEPMPPDHRARTLDGLVLSAHRAGGIPAAFLEIGEMVHDDLQLIAAGLPPARMQVAARELVTRYRNRPVQ